MSAPMIGSTPLDADARICGQLHRQQDDLFGSVLSACWRDLNHAGSCGDEPEQRFIEPWQPQVGQRVRVRLSAECEYCSEEIKVFNGATGTITDTAHNGSGVRGSEVDFAAHHYWVELDISVDGFTSATHYAAIELEPLDDEEPTS